MHVSPWAAGLLAVILPFSSGCAPRARVAGGAPPPAAVECGPELRGLDQVLRPGALLLFGEMHGTREAPGLVGRVVCRALRLGAPVRLGLELPPDEQPRLEAYLAGDGGAAAREALLSSDTWRRPEVHSGRASEAVLELVEVVRRLARSGADVGVFCFDSRPPDRERRMAENLLAARARAPRATTVVLTGNVHSRAGKGVPWDPEYEPMGLYLVRSGAAPTSLDLVSSGGAAWFCTGGSAADCGERPVRGAADRGAEPFIELSPGLRPDGHHGIYYVGPTTAAPPAAGGGR